MSDKIELDFKPDIVVYHVGDRHWKVWGDEEFFKSILEYVYNNIIKDNKNCWVFIQKSTLKHKLIEGYLID